jgi:hypothetical protein
MNQVSIIPLLFACLMLLTGACYSRISLGILQPAAITLPAKIDRVSVLPIAGKYSAQYDSLRFFHPKNDTIVYNVRMGYIHGIYDVLSSSPRFERMKLTQDSMAYKQSVFYWDQLRKICARDTTDVVLILTKCISYDFFGGMNDYKIGDYIFEDYFMINRTEWTFYAPYHETEITRLAFKDTVKVVGDFVREEFDDLYYDVCYNTGQRIGKNIAPYWMDAERLLFTGPGKDLKDAARFVEKEQWFKATRLWNQVAEDSNPVKAGKAAHNIAVAYEKDDNLDQALAWIAFADSITENKYTEEYKVVLEKRILKKASLDLQLLGN